MFRKILAVMVVLLLAVPCLSDAGLKDKVKSKAKSAASKTKSVATDAKDKAKDKAADAKDKAKSTAKDAAVKTKGVAKDTAGGVVQHAGSTAHKATTVPSAMAQGGAQVVKPVSGKASGAIESGAGKIDDAGSAVDKKAHSVGERIKN